MYEIDYFETALGVYWVLFRDKQRINGGLNDTQWEATREADYRMRADRTNQRLARAKGWAKGWARE